MIQNDRRQTPGSRFPERRHNVRNRLSIPGFILGFVVVLIILYQLWYLFRA